MRVQPTRSRDREYAGPGNGWGARARRGLLLPLLAILLPQMPLIGCSPQRRYEVLSFFFDGVPDPNAPRQGEQVDEQGRPVILAASFAHKPFEEGQCNACHTAGGGAFADFERVDDQVCLNCHESVLAAYPRMHGPVAVGECSHCHVPHESSIRPLLRDKPVVMCSTCHQRELLPPDPPDHLTARNCLECHVGHGGTQRGLLRAGWAPATLPAGAPVPAVPSTMPPAVQTHERTR